jgi:hypothetical protein
MVSPFWPSQTKSQRTSDFNMGYKPFNSVGQIDTYFKFPAAGTLASQARIDLKFQQSIAIKFEKIIN